MNIEKRYDYGYYRYYSIITIMIIIGIQNPSQEELRRKYHELKDTHSKRFEDIDMNSLPRDEVSKAYEVITGQKFTGTSEYKLNLMAQITSCLKKDCWIKLDVTQEETSAGVGY